MARFIRFAGVGVFWALLAFSAPAHAQGPPKRCAAVLGQPSPCSGLVLPIPEVKRALECKADLEDCKRKATKAASQCSVVLTACKRNLKAEQEKSAALDAIVQEKLAERPPEPWWKHPATPITLGLAVVGLAAAVIVLAVQPGGT